MYRFKLIGFWLSMCLAAVHGMDFHAGFAAPGPEPNDSTHSRLKSSFDYAGLEKNDFYATLGVAKTAGIDAITKAYRTKARRLHPDKGGNTDDFKELGLSYEVLSDEKRRKIYDRVRAIDADLGGDNAWRDWKRKALDALKNDNFGALCGELQVWEQAQHNKNIEAQREREQQWKFGTTTTTNENENETTQLVFEKNNFGIDQRWKWQHCAEQQQRQREKEVAKAQQQRQQEEHEQRRAEQHRATEKGWTEQRRAANQYWTARKHWAEQRLAYEQRLAEQCRATQHLATKERWVEFMCECRREREKAERERRQRQTDEDAKRERFAQLQRQPWERHHRQKEEDAERERRQRQQENAKQVKQETEQRDGTNTFYMPEGFFYRPGFFTQSSTTSTLSSGDTVVDNFQTTENYGKGVSRAHRESTAEAEQRDGTNTFSMPEGFSYMSRLFTQSSIASTASSVDSFQTTDN